MRDMKDKIIELIKKYQAESEKRWEPIVGYPNEYSHGYSVACFNCANDLEKLLKSMKGGDDK